MREWKETTISAIVTLISGGTPKTSVAAYWDGHIPWLSVVDFNNGKKYVFDTEKKITKEGLENSSTKLLEQGDIIISARGTVGVVAMLGRQMAFNQSCYGVRANENSSNGYVYYLLKDSVSNFLQYSHGGVFDTITRDTFKEIEILLPPLEVQNAIAKVLSSIDDKIDLLHRQNQTLEQMAETLFRQWFVEEADEEWKEVSLRSLCKVITKGTTPTSLKKQFVEAGINFIKVNCIDNNGNFLYDKFNFIDNETHSVVLKRSILQEGDLLYSIAGTIGRISEVTQEILPANINQALAILRVNTDIINPYYIKYSLKDPNITFNLHSKIVHAVQPNLSLGEIGSTLIPLPDKKTQQKFNEAINPIQAKIKTNQTQIRTLTVLRDTLLPKLMSGEIRVSDSTLKTI